jgi:phospholipid transport system substrate-binding protein
MVRRSLLTAGIVLNAVVLASTDPATAGPDPAAFINNLSSHLQMVTRSSSPEQKLAGIRQLLRADFDVPGLGRFVLGRFWRILTPSEQQEFSGYSRTISS